MYNNATKSKDPSSQDGSVTIQRKEGLTTICKLLFLWAFMIMATGINAQGPGTPQVNPPTGFKIDGSLSATPSVGDWIRGTAPENTPGSILYVLNDDGTPVNPGTTKFFRDPYGSGAGDKVFSQGSKFDDYIDDLSWTTKGASDKTDVNNAMYHISTDVNGHQWLFVAGDRASSNGSSYIEFELLQGTIGFSTTAGKFTYGGSATAAAGGRTPGDLLISMQYGGGGTSPSAVVYRWEWDAGNAKYVYKQLPLPQGSTYVATNTGTTEPIPFKAFGNSTYAPYLFVEAGVDVKSLIGNLLGNTCTDAFQVKTLWIKTKSSTAGTAALSDFVDPIPVSLTLGTANISYNIQPCSAATYADVTITGIQGGTFSASSSDLVFATSNDPNNPVPAGRINLSASKPGTYTVTYTFTVPNCSTPQTATTQVSVDGSVTVSDMPVLADACVSDGPVMLVPGTPAGGTWSGNGVSGNVANGFTFDPATAGVGTHTLTYTVTSGGCTGNGTSTINVTHRSVAPTIDPICAGSTVTGTTVAGAAVSVTSGSQTVDATVTGTTWTASFSTPLAGGASVSAMATEGGKCASAAASATVRATPVATISGNPTICETSGTASLNVSGTPSTTVAYTISTQGSSATSTGSVNLDGTGAGSISVSNLSATTTFTLNSVAYTDGTPGCSAAISEQAATVIVTPTVGTPAFSNYEAIICQGSGSVTYTASATNNTGMAYTLDQASSGAGVTINSSTGEVTYPADFSGSVTITATAQGCNGSKDNSITIAVRPALSATIGGTATVCKDISGSSAVTFTNNNAVAVKVHYTLNNVAQTAINIAAHSTQTVNQSAATVGSYVYALTSVAYQSDPECSAPLTGQSATVTVRAIPGASITGNATVCNDATATSPVTFSNSGDLPVIVTYSLNSTTGLTIEVPAASNNTAGTAVVNQSAAIAGTFVYAITSVAYKTAPACSAPVSNQSATVTVRSLPSATISGTDLVCQDTKATSVITFSNPGSLPITVTYAVNSAAGLTVQVPAASGATPGTATVRQSQATAGNFVYTITSVAYQSSPGCSTSINNQSATITVNGLPQIPGSLTISAVYSDPLYANNKFTVTDDGAGSNLELVAGSIKWKSGSNGTLNNGLPANFILEPGNSPTADSRDFILSASKVNLAPGTYYIQFSVTDGQCQSAGTITLNVVPEDVCSEFTGNVLFVNTNTSGVLPQGTSIPLSFVVSQNDVNLGDLSQQSIKVTISGDNGSYSNVLTLYPTSISSDGETAPYSTMFNPFTQGSKLLSPLTSSNASATLTVDIEVAGHFTNASCTDQTLITISYPANDFTTGGGYIWNTNSTKILGRNGTGDIKKNNYGFNVKWNKNGTNLQGTFTTVIRKDGRLYQVKSNKPSYISTKTNGTYLQGGKVYNKYIATIVYSNAVIKELKGTTCTLVPGCSVGNGTIALKVYDNGEPGSLSTSFDQIGFTIRDGSNQLFYATDNYNTSDPEKYFTSAQTDVAGGNLQVHVGNGFVQLANPSTTVAPTMDIAQTLQLSALPNPSRNNFTLQLQGSAAEKMQVRVTDVSGRTVQLFNNLSAGQTLKIGADYKQGVYVVELIQGTNRTQTKLIKTN